MFKMTSVAQSPAEKTSPGAPHSLQRLHGGGAPRAHSIRSRLTLIYHSVALLIVGMTWAGGMSYEFYRERVRVQQHLESQAVMLAANATAAITFSDAAAAGEVLSALRFLNTVRWAVILDADYQRLAAYGEMPPDLADWRQSLHGQAVAIDLDTIRVSQVISYDNKRVGTLLIEGSLDELNRHFLTTVSVSLLIIMLVVILGNRLFDRLSRAITDPINALIKVSRSVSETGDFRRRVEIRNRDELGQLSADFNGMLASLEDRENALRAELEERTRVQAKLDNLAHFDQVTNLPNRGSFSHATLAARRADLISMRVLGWADGRPAVDYTINAATGYPMMTGPVDATGPVNHVLPAWDLLTGALGATNLLAAERRRHATGEGAEILLPLSDVAFSTLGRLGHVAEVTMSGADRPRSGNDLFGAFGRDFATADGERIMLIGLTAKQWSSLIEVLDIATAIAALETDVGADFTRDEGARFVHRTRLGPIFAEAIAHKPLAELAPLLERAGATWSVYRTVKQALERETGLSLYNPLFQTIAHPSGGSYLTPGAPSTWATLERGAVPAAPRLGAHTDAVLSAILGLPDHEIARLRDAGLVAG